MVSLGYLGSTGNHLLRREMSDTANLHDYAVLSTNRAGSDYDALQMQYRRHVAAGLDATASYAWSHSLDNDSSDAFLLWSGEGASAHGDHASSDFDVRHAFTTALELRVSRTRRPHRRRGVCWADGASTPSCMRAADFPSPYWTPKIPPGLGLANAFRPDWVYGQPLWIADRSAPGGKTLNPAAFVALPAPLGPSGRKGTWAATCPPDSACGNSTWRCGGNSGWRNAAASSCASTVSMRSITPISAIR